jgi:hypothetical protein
MDVAQKKQEVLESIARGPETIVFARIDICNEIQLSDLLKTSFIPKLREAANTSFTGHSDSLHEVCSNLARQRALLQGAVVNDILSFNIDDGSVESRADGTAPHNTSGNLSFPVFEDASYSNKTTIPYTVLHDFNETGGTVTLSSSSNANTTITDNDGNDVKYFTDFSKYFLTAGRANGELVSIDQNLTPYTTPTASEPFLPANTINGEVLRGAAPDPTANTDVRHEFVIVANTSGGNAGGDLDIAENKYVGNTFVTLGLVNVSGTFTVSETLTDFEGETATIKTYSNTSTVLLESTDSKGTFTVGETVSDSTTNATISSAETTSNTSVNIKLTGSTFLTGSNTDTILGFSTSNTISLDTGAVSRSGSTVTVIANNHGIGSGERVVLKGADAEFGEFNDTFIIQGVTANTLSFVTSNATSVSPTGDFTLMNGIIFGQSSNASAAVFQRTVNASANIVFQSSNLSTGFAIANTVSNDADSTGIIDSRTIGGAWYQTKTAEVKTYYTTSTSGTWNYDATNNPLGIESTANVGLFWLDNFKPVKINQLTGAGAFALDDGRIQLEDSIGGYLLMDSTDDAGTENVGDNILHEQFDESAISAASTSVAEKIVLDIALATSSDTTGGYDDTAITTMPGIYFAYPMKTYADQTHDGTVTLEAYDNFANVIIAPEGLEINFDWKPLANTSGVATNTTHLHANGDVVTTAHNPEECTVLDEIEFNSHLGPYGSAIALPKDDIFLSSIASTRSSGKKVGTSGAVYPSANANPFYPAVAGTHKEITNTDNDLTGTQPGSLTANDIYAGTYTQIDTGGVDPGTVAAPQDYRYIIQNDLKWVYATSPFAAPLGAATSTGQGQVYNVPRLKTAGTFTPLYDGYSKSDGFGPLIDSIEAQSGTAHTHNNAIPVDIVSTVSGSSTNRPSTPPSLGSASCFAGDGTSAATIVTYSSASYNNVHVWRWITSTRSGNKVTTSTTTDTVTSTTCYNNSDGTTGSTTAYVVGRASSTTQNYTFNAIQDVLNNANTATFVTMVTSLQTGNETTYGAGYRDPNEPSSPNLKTDAVFDADVNTMYTAYTNAKNYHDAVIDGTSNGYSDGVAHTYANTTYAAFITGVGTFQTAMTLRISEITARIGYLNGKNVADGGSVDGSGTAGSGFAGTSFNGGSGYANTIYSHCNFLAGKKIKLIQKILQAIEDVGSLYNQIKSKRSEYYEYNQ